LSVNNYFNSPTKPLSDPHLVESPDISAKPFLSCNLILLLV